MMTYDYEGRGDDGGTNRIVLGVAPSHAYCMYCGCCGEIWAVLVLIVAITG